MRDGPQRVVEPRMRLPEPSGCATWFAFAVLRLVSVLVGWAAIVIVLHTTRPIRPFSVLLVVAVGGGATWLHRRWTQRFLEAHPVGWSGYPARRWPVQFEAAFLVVVTILAAFHALGRE